ncbi:MAG: right-handed parallel beta-helix repeat-containing protein [Clostridia bacterium]|nr:right-handed parallel beta-helix repeat-containing protein [Clostridia bacterium]
MGSSDDEVQIAWGDSAGHRQMPEFDRGNVKEYAFYGFHEVKQSPLVNFTFDGMETIDDPIVSTGCIPGIGKISGSGSASLTDGRSGLGKALHFSGTDTCLSAPDLGRLDALTISCWVKLRDVQTRENTDAPRETVLLDSAAGTGRVTLKLVHTGIPPHAAEDPAETDPGSNNTKLVFSVEGNEGGTYGQDSLYANNQRYYEYEYTFADRANDWTCHPSEHCWIHVAVVYNPGNRTVTFYNSGKRDSEQSFTKAEAPVLNGIRIGAGNEAGRFLDGAVDDIRIYGEALGAEDIEALGDFERDMWVYRTAGSRQESTTVYYVDGEKGDDGNPGTREAPFATIRKGVESVQNPGTRVVIMQGLYREAGIELTADGTELRPVIIEAEKPGEVIITGSTVLGNWKAAGLPDVYVHEWSRTFPVYNTSGNEFACRTDMLYIDGQPMKPVSGLSKLQTDSYYLDTEENCVYVMTGKAPESFTAEIPDLGTGRGNNGEAYLMNCNSHEYIVLRGLTFTGCATTIHSGMVKTGTARHMLIEDCTFNNANGQGLEIEHGTGERIAEDIMIRRCRFDRNGYGAIQAGFRSMNIVIENCEFTRTGWKVDWGEYDAPDPATLKMMFMKNVIVRRNRFSSNHDNDLWIDNSNWNVDIDGNSFTGNETEISVHTEINPFGIQIRNNTGGGIRFANSEGTIVTHNILATRSHPLITYWGTEVRYDGNNRGRINQGGPGLSWKDTVLTDNTFILPGPETKAADLPPFESFYRMTASGNRFLAGKVKKHNRVFSVRGKAVGYDDFIRAVGDEYASFEEEPFRDREKATVGFRENASVSKPAGLPNYIPVALSEPMEKPVSVSYILWNADTGEEIGRGVLDFDPYQCEKGIYTGEGGTSVLAELTAGRGIHPGEQLIHFQTAGKTEQEGGTSP